VDRQPIQRMTIFRLILALPGVFLLIHSAERQVDWIGALMMTGAAILYALHLLINQRILYEVPAPTVTLYTLLAMSGTVLIAFLIFDRQMLPVGTVYYPVLGLAAITFFSRITLFLGVKHLGGMQTAVMGLAELLVTVFTAAIFLHETLTVTQWIGALMLAASLLLVGFDRYTPEKRRNTGILSWLNPPQIHSTDIPWQN
jgi:drug/metabolite transporter (DMT)-like permease